VPPAPKRPTSWQTFLRAHWGAIAGADFLTTEVWTWRGLVTFYTVFVVDLATRRVQVLGTTPHPDEAFMRQVVRTLSMADGEVCRVLICDRDAKWSAAVRAQLEPRLSRSIHRGAKLVGELAIFRTVAELYCGWYRQEGVVRRCPADC
jgi:hypothetical protein